MAEPKIQALLASAIGKLASSPGSLLDIVVTPATCDSGPEAIVQHVTAQGGQAIHVTPESVQLRLPVKAVTMLAESGLVSEMRLARTARMH